MGLKDRLSLLKSPTYASSEEVAPPPYSEKEQQQQQQLHDDLAARASNLRLNDDPELRVGDRLPRPDEAFVHLKLLHAIHTLRKSISQQDGLFGFFNADICGEKRDAADEVSPAEQALLDKLAEKRWAVYLARAAQRFEVWWQGLRKQTGAKQLTMEIIRSSDAEGGLWHDWVQGHGKRVSLRQSDLPPLDVLMVWHAFHLNPQCYLEDCLRQDMMCLWCVGLPWDAINASLGASDGVYEPGERARNNWGSLARNVPVVEDQFRLSWDNTADPSTLAITCPNQSCQSAHEVRWTLIDATEIRKWSESLDPEAPMPPGVGFAEPGFLAECPSCNSTIDHDGLCAAKFIRDSESLVSATKSLTGEADERIACPMPGTILNSHGVSAAIKIDSDHRLFANRLIQGMAYEEWSREWKSVAEIRSTIEEALRDRALLQASKDMGRATLSRLSRVYVRKMLARYWSNSSLFSLDLVGAVARQGSFIEKMERIDWLHSPAGLSTMARLGIKYERFLTIMASRLNQITVPTLDVDIMWHTHQLAPKMYYDYCLKHIGGTFIDHDDKVAETVLHDAFSETTKVYQKRYREPYSECTCWYCESIRAAHAPTTASLFRSGALESAEARMLYDRTKPAPSDPDSGPHISTHNAIRPSMRPSGRVAHDARLRALNTQLGRLYEKAVKRARKEGRAEPQRPSKMVEMSGGKASRSAQATTAVGAGAGGFLLTGAFVAGTDGMEGDGVYTSNPGCASAGDGAVGNCARGTCGASAGDCVGAGYGMMAGLGVIGGGFGGGAGAGGAACAGGAGGGCGGGGGGGCGGGGGGGA